MLLFQLRVGAVVMLCGGIRGLFLEGREEKGSE